MKKGTRITLFVASMALTVGSLIAFAGPHRCGGMYKHYGYANHERWQGCDRNADAHNDSGPSEKR